MDLYKELLIKALKDQEIKVTLSSQSLNLENLVELKSYALLEEIKLIIQNEALNDNECFLKIEEIINLFQRNNIDTGLRHDF